MILPPPLPGLPVVARVPVPFRMGGFYSPIFEVSNIQNHSYRLKAYLP